MSDQKSGRYSTIFKVDVTFMLDYRPSFETLCSIAIEKLERAIRSEQCREDIDIIDYM